MANELTEIERDLPVSFYFQVEFEKETIVPFKEVSGLSVELETETIQEGGVNEYDYKFPKQIKHGNLVLKRALLPLSNSLETWIYNCLGNDFSQSIVTKNISVKLLNEKGDPLRSWVCSSAYPVKWDIDSFEAEKNAVVIESIEFTYLKQTRVM